MKKKGTLKRVLCLVSALVVGLTMTGMSVYAADGVEGTPEPKDVKKVEEKVSTQGEGGELSTPTATGELNSAGNAYDVTLSWEGGTAPYDVYIDGEKKTEESITDISYNVSLPLGKIYTLKVEDAAPVPVSKECKFLAMKATAKASDGKVTVEWTGIEGITDYVVSADGVTSQTVKGTPYTYTFESLTNGQKYLFNVKAGTEADAPSKYANSVVPGTAVTGLKALKDYNGVTLKWNTIQGDEGEKVQGYFVYRNNGQKRVVAQDIEKDVTTYYFNGAGENQGHTYKVQPYYEDEIAGQEAKVSGYTVRQAYVYFKVKRTKTLTSHSGGKVKITVKKNQRYKATGFGSGKYHFYVNGRLYYINRTSTKNASYEYTRSFNYSNEEAQNYVNHRGLSSRTGKLVWASFYTQHVYIFSGSRGNWKCINGWEISTGKASSPSPTGVKSIGKKLKKRHGLRYWSCFSSMNAFHGVNASSWKRKLGTPQSGGCIRNLTNQAQWIYNAIPKGTTVLCY